VRTFDEEVCYLRIYAIIILIVRTFDEEVSINKQRLCPEENTDFL